MLAYVAEDVVKISCSFGQYVEQVLWLYRSTKRPQCFFTFDKKAGFLSLMWINILERRTRIL